MKTGPLYEKFRECTKKIRVVQGGGDAAKTVTILQDIATDLIFNKNLIATVSAESVPNIKGGALRSFQNYVASDREVGNFIKSYNETDRKFTFYGNSIMEFKSFRDEKNAAGSERHILFLNEANTESYETFWQLQRKTRRKIYLDYNPTSPFWAHAKVIPGEGQAREFFNKVQFYRVWHQHNPFLEQEDHDTYEAISDPDLFKVYSRGLTGKVKGLIFAHYKKWVGELPQDYQRIIWGIDYGYTNDPTAIVKIYVGPGRRRISQELSYEPGLSAETLKNIFLFNGLKQGQAIYSEADPNMINQLRVIGIPAEPAIKGPGSIAAGLSKTKEFDNYYIGANFEKEIMNYKWLSAQDIVTGKEVMTNVPIDAWNHLCDADRMAKYTDSFRHR